MDAACLRQIIIARKFHIDRNEMRGTYALHALHDARIDVNVYMIGIFPHCFID